jgi:hypothetical protein
VYFNPGALVADHISDFGEGFFGEREEGLLCSVLGGGCGVGMWRVTGCVGNGARALEGRVIRLLVHRPATRLSERRRVRRLAPLRVEVEVIIEILGTLQRRVQQ